MAAKVEAAVLAMVHHQRSGNRLSSLTSGWVRWWLLCVCACWTPAASVQAASNKVRITNLSDVSFGTLSDLTGDTSQSQSVCLFADTIANGYNVTASGSGPSGTFQLASGSQMMAYEVQWSDTANRNSGGLLTPNVPFPGQISGASHQTCANGPATSASLIILLRSAALSTATAGNYTGTLTLLIGPE